MRTGTTLKKFVKSLLLNLLWYTLGRKNLVRFARFLSNESRLDVNNDPSSNGEFTVQSCIFANCGNNQTICVFDVGANTGSWIHSFIELNKSYTSKLSIYAFEPCRDTYATLLKNLRIWHLADQIQTENLALSSFVGRHCFYSIGPNLGRNSFYPIKDSPPQTIEEVETETVDNYCFKNGISHISFIKVDTEGHDLEVLYGCEDMLARQAVDLVQFEYNHRWIDARHFLRDAFDFFLPFGFIIGKITPRGIEFYSTWDYELETFNEANYLAMKPSLKSIFPQIKWWKELS
jgi:FkbM family methyltransferase